MCADYCFSQDFNERLRNELDELSKPLRDLDRNVRNSFRHRLDPANPRSFLKDPDFRRHFIGLEEMAEQERLDEMEYPAVMSSFIYQFRYREPPKGDSMRATLLEVRSLIENEAGPVLAADEPVVNPIISAACALFRTNKRGNSCLSKMKCNYDRLYIHIDELVALMLDQPYDGRASLAGNADRRLIGMRIKEVESLVTGDTESLEAHGLAGRRFSEALAGRFSADELERCRFLIARLYNPLMHLAIMRECNDRFDNLGRNSGKSFEIIDRYCEMSNTRLSDGPESVASSAGQSAGRGAGQSTGQGAGQSAGRGAGQSAARGNRGRNEPGEEDRIQAFYDRMKVEGGDSLFIPLKVDANTATALCIIGRAWLSDAGYLLGDEGDAGDIEILRMNGEFERAQTLARKSEGKRAMRDAACFFAVFEPRELGDDFFDTIDQSDGYLQDIFPNCMKIMYGVDWPDTMEETSSNRRVSLYQTYADAERRFNNSRGNALNYIIREKNGVASEGYPASLLNFFQEPVEHEVAKAAPLTDGESAEYESELRRKAAVKAALEQAQTAPHGRTHLTENRAFKRPLAGDMKTTVIQPVAEHGRYGSWK